MECMWSFNGWQRNQANGLLYEARRRCSPFLPRTTTTPVLVHTQESETSDRDAANSWYSETDTAAPTLVTSDVLYCEAKAPTREPTASSVTVASPTREYVFLD